MDYIKLANKLRESGFPAITRWEIENNYKRPILVKGESLPPLGALLSEFPYDVLVWKHEDTYIASAGIADYVDMWGEYADSEENQKAGIVGQKFIRGTIDGYLNFPESGDTPEIAVAKLYIAMKALLQDK